MASAALENRCYGIVSYRWDDSSAEGKAKLADLLRTDPATAAKFCEIYFNRFDIVHKMGHIFLDAFNGELTDADLDIGANLFAVKYFQRKKESAYLDLLSKWIKVLLRLYGVGLDVDWAKVNGKYGSYRRDLRTYAAIHFCGVLKCLDEPEDLDQVIARLGRGKAQPVNKGIILRQGLKGADLVNECVSAVFEMNDMSPGIELSYAPEISLGNIELVRR
jgi:hypothetical protein